MSKETVQQFLARLTTDSALADELQKACAAWTELPPGAVAQAVVTFAAEKGFPFTAEDWESVLSAQELTSDALHQLHAGIGHWKADPGHVRFWL